jgi:ribonuclease P protein component
MSSLSAPTLSKVERISGRTLVEKLFNGNDSHSMSSFPLRMVYMTSDKTDDVYARMMVSVSKRHFKRAVKRNRIKRQVREAFRHQKYLLQEPLTREGKNVCVAVAFIWLSDELYSSEVVDDKVKRLLQRLCEKL